MCKPERRVENLEIMQVAELIAEMCTSYYFIVVSSINLGIYFGISIYTAPTTPTNSN